MGEMLPNFDLVIPFDSKYMMEQKETNLMEKFLSKYNGAKSIYHRSALQALVMSSVTSHFKNPWS
jgi:hypothetical protein